MKNRSLAEVISQRLAEKMPLIQVVIGPRQVGKTTALKAALPTDAHYYSADYPTPLNASVIYEWWHKAQKSKCAILAIDEVQKIIGWSDIIKSLWDQNSGLKVVLTGASALLMEKGLKESLAGRFELIKAEHWNLSEANEIFNLDINAFIEFGCYPGAVRFLDDLDRWGSYIRDSIVEPVLGRDLLQLYRVDNPSLLRQIFGVAVNMPAQIISLQKIQGQLQNKGSVPTIQHYLTLLSQSFLISALSKYSQSVIRERKSSPKLIVHDNSLMRAFERPIADKLVPEKFGRYFENIVASRFVESGWDTFYWKDRLLEVDIIAIGPENQKWAIEVKSTKCSRSDLKGLDQFIRIYPEFTPKLISLAEQTFDDIETVDPAAILGLCHKYQY